VSAARPPFEAVLIVSERNEPGGLLCLCLEAPEDETEKSEYLKRMGVTVGSVDAIWFILYVLRLDDGRWQIVHGGAMGRMTNRLSSFNVVPPEAVAGVQAQLRNAVSPAYTPFIPQHVTCADMSGIHSVVALFSLLTSRQIEARPVTPDPALAKARAKKGQPPGCTYRVLWVDTSKAKHVPVELTGVVPMSRLMQAMHWQAGHWKTYTDDGKLFGKWTGTYLWGSGIRGSDASRWIEKDYHIRKKAS
jgi:hypothetical protein